MREAWKTNSRLKQEAMARGVESTKSMFSETRRNVRQIMRLKSDAEVGPILCGRIGDALMEGRLHPSELSWTDGLSTRSPRLIRVLQGR